MGYVGNMQGGLRYSLAPDFVSRGVMTSLVVSSLSRAKSHLD